jgi:hypothetical protein
MKKYARFIGFVYLLILVVFISGCINSNNNTSNQSSKNVILQIISESSWTGTLTYSGTNYSIKRQKIKITI